MSSLAPKARNYIFLITAFAVGAVFICIADIAQTPTYWLVTLASACIIAALDLFPIQWYGVRLEMTISNAIKFAIVLLYPIPVVVLSIVLGTWFGELPAKRKWFHKLFNVAEMALTWIITAEVYTAVSNPAVDYFGSIQNILALILAGGISFATNSTMVCLVISLAAHLPFLYVWKQNSKVSLWHEASLFTLGAFFAILWHYNPVSIILAGLPLWIVRDSYKTANQLRNQTTDALRALVRVVDERDHHTMNHSELVSTYSQSIAEKLELPQEEIEIITSAALLHDLGKVGMADDILFNPKLLNPVERKSAEHHAEIGAMLLSKFPLFDKGAILVRHHHERFDGHGYPNGLNGETIPLGSRIIAIADSYQAMTEDRPYRHALSQEEALARLKEGGGTQFDPRLVDAFIQTLTKA